jgi:hypothetical protein
MGCRTDGSGGLKVANPYSFFETGKSTDKRESTDRGERREEEKIRRGPYGPLGNRSWPARDIGHGPLGNS